MSVGDTTVEPMQLADLDAVLEIERVAFHAQAARQGFIEELAREWARLEVLAVATPDGERRVVGYLDYWLVRDELHLLSLAVHPGERRRGHGRTLMQHLVAVALSGGCRYVTLEVRRSNLAAIELYRGFGFTAVGVRPRYYVDDDEDAVVMLLELPEAEPSPGG